MINITNPSKCCGCGSCIQICPKQCIHFDEDPEGFRYPQADLDKCIECGLCESRCPMLNTERKRSPLQVLAARNKDESILLQSSSGGVFYLLAEHIIKKGGVVFGAQFNEDWEVEHSYTENLHGVAKFQRSKYVQSLIGDTYKAIKQFLNEGRTVLFTGTPCQVAGLNKYLIKKYDNLLTVDFVCHGVPSPMVWRDYLSEIVSTSLVNENRNCNQDITSISFRDKSFGWKKFSLVINGKGCNGFCLKEPLDVNPYMKAFLHNIIIRPSCFDCPFKCGRSGSDITIADFWGGDLFHSAYSDDKGISLIMPYTKCGQSIIRQLSIDYELSSYRKALRCNSAIIKSHHKHPNREVFFKHYRTKQSVIEWILECDKLSFFDQFIVGILSIFDRASSKIRYYVTKD